MRINNINNSLSFGRVITIKQSKSGNTVPNKQYEQAAKEISHVLNSKESDIYSYNEAKKIKKFFQDTLGDYDGRNGIIIRKTKKGIVMLSGEDAQQIRDTEKTLAHERQNLRENKHNRSDIKSTYIRAEREIRKRIEDGRFNKPETTVYLGFEKHSSSPKVSCIAYSSLAQSFYEIKDGHIDKEFKNQPKRQYGQTALVNTAYEESELNI